MCSKFLIKDILQENFKNKKVVLEGWLKSVQIHSENLIFIQLNDGSNIENLQVVCKKKLDDISMNIGAAFKIEGTLKDSYGKNQKYELIAEKIELLSQSELDFPIQKKEHSLEFLRNIAHQRHRTKLFLSVNLIKKELSYAIHKFFYENNFFWIQSPILTTNNCEGGSEVFKISNSENFFKKSTLLTVSGQFHAEALALGLKNVYTFGPTFRAEKSNTSCHLAEFWMIEPEMSFSNLQENLKLIEKFIKYVVKHVLDKCKNELEFLSKKIEDNEDLIKKLENLISSDFEKIEYYDVIELLKKAQKEEAKFKNQNIEFGIDLSSEHECYITEKIFKKPCFVINYPKEIKAFYMKLNSDNKTVKAVDLLVPGVGELIGGSERENCIEKLKQQANSLNIPLENLQWYINLRKYGFSSSAGFGCGFERLIMYLTGLKNIKDTVNFPRSYQQINF